MSIYDVTEEYKDACKAMRRTIKALKHVPESMITAAMVDELLRYCKDEEGRKLALGWMQWNMADVRAREAFARREKARGRRKHLR